MAAAVVVQPYRGLPVGRTALEAAEDAIEQDGVDVSRELEAAKPAPSILSYVDEHEIDQIVMGSTGGSGVSRVLLGRIAKRVARGSSVPVTVVR